MSGATIQETQGSRESCTCPKCVSCCERRPGWFKPGEAEKVAAFLGLTLQELFDTKLEADYWINDSGEPNTLLLAPARVGHPSGTVSRDTWSPTGRCVFLSAEGRCSIHAVKPFECAVAFCGDGPVDLEGSAHQVAADAWRAPEHQAQVETLLEPKSQRGSSRRGRAT
jgi:Fe-S-cluster containining protein